jgi:hypothetical protein
MQKQTLSNGLSRLILSFLFFLLTNSANSQLKDKFSDEEDVYSFELPAGTFKKVNENYFTSIPLSASIKFRSESDYLGDDIFDANIKEQIKIAKKGLKVTYQNVKKDKFTISGIDKNGNIVYIKGNTEDLYTRSNPENQDEMVWRWTKTMLVTFNYPPSSKKGMDVVIASFLKSYQYNLGLL